MNTDDSPTEVTLSHRLQILSTEHWSLLASRSLAWSESFSRATMFLAVLSGAVVALALVAQASAFGRVFPVFALIILPVVLFVGVTTVVRMGATNYHDATCVMGMNRIRHAYLEIAPDLAPYFVMGSTDDPPGVAITMGLPPSDALLPTSAFGSTHCDRGNQLHLGGCHRIDRGGARDRRDPGHRVSWCPGLGAFGGASSAFGNEEHLPGPSWPQPAFSWDAARDYTLTGSGSSARRSIRSTTRLL